MERLIIFGTGAGLGAVSEFFWQGRGRLVSILGSGVDMLLLRRILLRFPGGNRAALCLLGVLILLSSHYILTFFQTLFTKERPAVRCLYPAGPYALFRCLLVAPAYIIIEYLEGFFRM